MCDPRAWPPRRVLRDLRLLEAEIRSARRRVALGIQPGPPLAAALEAATRAQAALIEILGEPDLAIGAGRNGRRRS